MRRLCFLLATSLLVAFAPGPSSAVDLQPHRAVYRMVLANTTHNSDVVSADGVMVYRFARGCDGWTVENRTFLRLLRDNETESDSLWSFASWESVDGRSFHFHARYEQDGKTIEKLEGEAQLKRFGAGRARFSEPSGTEIRLPIGTLFPTEHIRQVLAAAAKGKHLLSRTVFDGASLDNPYEISAVMRPLSPTDAETLAKNVGLAVEPSFWTRMAFFALDDSSPEAEFEMDAKYRADGIADQIIQQFDTFSLDVRLKEIELLPPPDC